MIVAPGPVVVWIYKRSVKVLYIVSVKTTNLCLLHSLVSTKKSKTQF